MTCTGEEGLTLRRRGHCDVFRDVALESGWMKKSALLWISCKTDCQLRQVEVMQNRHGNITHPDVVITDFLPLLLLYRRYCGESCSY